MAAASKQKMKNRRLLQCPFMSYPCHIVRHNFFDCDILFVVVLKSCFSFVLDYSSLFDCLLCFRFYFIFLMFILVYFFIFYFVKLNSCLLDSRLFFFFCVDFSFFFSPCVFIVSSSFSSSCFFGFGSRPSCLPYVVDKFGVLLGLLLFHQ